MGASDMHQVGDDSLPQLTADELRRFSRHLILPEFGLTAQRRLKASSVLLIGLGGLGSPAALYLAAAGVGRIGLVDADVVEESNLQRQIIHGHSVLGKLKAESAETRMLDLNPGLVIERHDVRFNLENALELIGQYDVVIDGTDNFPTRYLVNDACVKLGKPNVFGSVLRFDGQLSVFDARFGPCYRCLFPEPPPAELSMNCSEAGVLGVLPGVIGSLQATEAIKILSGVGTPLVGRMLIYDGLDMSFDTIDILKSADCPACSLKGMGAPLKETLMVCAAPVGQSLSCDALLRRLNEADDLLVVDVRNPVEWAQGMIGGAIGLPKPRLEQMLAEPGAQPLPQGQDIVVVCQSGMRSSAVIRALQAAGYDAKRLYNLERGMAAWTGPSEPPDSADTALRQDAPAIQPH